MDLVPNIKRNVPNVHKKVFFSSIIGGTDRARTLPQRGIRPGIMLSRTGSTVGENPTADNKCK